MSVEADRDHRFYDLSLPISGRLPVWPGDPPVRVILSSSLDRGDPANVSRLDLGSHTGTHIDAPLHFEAGGAPVDRLPLAVLIGPARLVSLDVDEKITRADLEGVDLRGVSRLLFKTKNCLQWKSSIAEAASGSRAAFHENYIYLSEDAAEYLVDRGIRLVGVDYLSVESFHNKSFSTHHCLLRAGVVILEGLNPSDVPPGDYELIALPLRLEGGDGAPARVILRARD